jgi:hypothetical protein
MHLRWCSSKGAPTVQILGSAWFGATIMGAVASIRIALRDAPEGPFDCPVDFGVAASLLSR